MKKSFLSYFIKAKTASLNISVLCVFVLFFVACDQSAPQQKISGQTMGTSYHITIVDELNAEQSKAIASAVQQRLDDIENRLSTYKEDSELMQFNRSPSTQTQTISYDFYQVMKDSKTVWKESNGALDVSIAPLIQLWGFNSEDMKFDVPSAQQIKEARAKTGMGKILLSEKDNCQKQCWSIRKMQPVLEVNLSAVAKGYAVDELAKLFYETYQLKNFLLEVGGEVFASGAKANGQSWRLGIEEPDKAPGAVYGSVLLQNKAIATSGDYRNYYEKNGKRYSHTLSPKTAMPIKHGLASVSVIHDRVALADAWATALNVLGPEQGVKLANDKGLAAYFIIRQDDKFVVRYTPKFHQFIENTR